MDDKERIRQLEQQIEVLREQQSRYIMQMGDEIERRTRLLKQQLDKEYSRTYKEAMERSMQRLQAQRSDQAEKELRRLRAETERLEQEAEQTRAALRDAEKYRSRTEQTGRAEAVKALERLDSDIKHAEAMPCEEFFPKKLSIYTNAMTEGKRLFGNGMFSQAFSVLSSALLGIKRLTVDCANRSKLLTHYVEQFRAALNEVKTQLSSVAAHTVEYNNETITLTDDELELWSDGLTGQLYSELEEYERILRAINHRGVKAVRNMTEGDPVEYIREKTESLVMFGSRAQITLEYAFSCCIDYWDFEAAYPRAVSAMDTQGFSVMGCRYGSSQPDISMPASFAALMSREQCTAPGGKADLRERREVLFRHELLNGETETAVLSFHPVRNDTQVYSQVTMQLTTKQANKPLYQELEAVLAAVGIPADTPREAPIHRHILRMDEVNRIAAERISTSFSSACAVI